MNYGLIDQIAEQECRELREEMKEGSAGVIGNRMKIGYRIDLISQTYREAIQTRMREILLGE